MGEASRRSRSPRANNASTDAAMPCASIRLIASNTIEPKIKVTDSGSATRSSPLSAVHANRCSGTHSTAAIASRIHSREPAARNWSLSS